MAYLTVRSLTKSFGWRPVLQDLDLRLGPEECVALCGRNGTGKSTLLRILAGLATADEGQIHFAGMAQAEAGSALRSRIGYLGHTPGMHPARSLQAHLQFAACIYGLVDPAQRIRALLHSAGLGHVAHSPVGQLSRGMQQRGALCRAWLHDPRILLLDEPDAHLDAEGLQFLDLLLSSRHAAHQTILFATHHRDHVRRWADREVVLHDGRLQAACPSA